MLKIANLFLCIIIIIIIIIIIWYWFSIDDPLWNGICKNTECDITSIL